MSARSTAARRGASRLDGDGGDAATLRRMDEAERRCRAFLASHERRAGQIDARLASVLTQLAALRQARGDLFEAEALYLRALDTLATAAESDESCRVACIDGLAGLFDATACDDEARRLRAGMWRV